MFTSKRTHWPRIVVSAGLVLLTNVGCGAPASQTTTTNIASSVQLPSSQAVPQDKVVLKVSGSGSVMKIMKNIQADFEADTPNTQLEFLDVSSNGSSADSALQGVTKGVLDVVVMTRKPKAEAANQGIKYAEIGKLGIAVVTHDGVGIKSLTKEQVQGIFSGKITNWSTVGGSNVPITVFTRPDDNSTTKAFRNGVFGEATFPASAQVLDKSSELRAGVTGTPGSISFGGWPDIVANGDKMTAIALDGVRPNDVAYSMAQPFIFSFGSTQEANVRPLLDWLLSPTGQAALGKFDIISVQ